MKMRALMGIVLALFVSAGPALGQGFSISAIGPEENADQSVIALSHNGRYVLYQSYGESICYAILDRTTGLDTRRCPNRVESWVDINNNGVAIGSVSDGSQSALIPVKWEMNSDVVVLPYLNDGDTVGEARGINDKGEIVGFSGKVVSYNVLYNGEVLDDPTTTVHARAVRWSKKNAVREIKFSAPQFSAVAGAINNRGLILVSRSGSPVPENGSTINDGDDARVGFGPYLFIEKSKVQRLRTSGYASLYISLPYGMGPKQAYGTVADDGEILIVDRIFHKHSREVSKRWRGGRGDFFQGGVLGLDNAAILQLSDKTVLDTKNGESVIIDCLLPQTEKITGTNLPVSAFAHNSGQAVGGVSTRGEVVFSEDLTGDDRLGRMFVLTPDGRESFSNLHDYCPVLEVSQDGNCSDPSSTRCSGQIIVNPGAAGSYPGISVELIAMDADRIDANGTACGTGSLGKLTTDFSNSAHFDFTIDRHMDYAIFIPSFPSQLQVGTIQDSFIYPAVENQIYDRACTRFSN